MVKHLRDVCTLPESECSGAPDAALSSAICRGNHSPQGTKAQSDF
jgi:hypothetical protein